jgi:hypothetical protein
MTDPQGLSSVIRGFSSSADSPEIDALRVALLDKYGESVLALLFYGSCLRSGNHLDGLVDLYVVVDRYRRAYGRWLPALANKLLPPNVFYMEVPYAGKTVRAKYAVISMRDFRKANSMRCFHSYFWARFAQPTGIAWVRDDNTRTTLHEVFSEAITTFLNRVLPALEGTFSIREAWQQGLLMTYGAELRAEKPGRITALYTANTAYYEKIFVNALPRLRFRVVQESAEPASEFTIGISAMQRAWNRTGWFVRKIQGKVLSVLRLLKALFTFQAGVQYILWKIERHSGVRAQVPPRLGKHPLLASLVLFWKIRRRGGFR